MALSLANCTFLLTGTLPSLTRDCAIQLVEHYGGQVHQGPSSTTDYVVIGEKAGKVKLKKLDNLPNIIQLNELGLLKLIADKSVTRQAKVEHFDQPMDSRTQTSDSGISDFSNLVSPSLLTQEVFVRQPSLAPVEEVPQPLTSIIETPEKASQSEHSGPLPLRQRKLDCLYVAFFSLHLLATILVDGQTIYPIALVPPALTWLKEYYLRTSGDFLVANALKGEYAWFGSFLVMEMIFQLPCFVLGLKALRADDRRVFPLLLAFACVTSTTTLACCAQLVFSPQSVELAQEQKLMLASSYVPFCAVPLLMAFDMYGRVMRGSR